ncbi:MipA/OmpV family protein [Rheinheimera sp. MM224]|uniref:MipA/OmpV family protein n=1 Tax=Rheinheimera sp. MM224 TaxID=3019969 RepID=UPI0021F8CCED|nr:MipA/OmpV family protein [Rheinheimera sp. MM224]CAI3794494.1 hypothetical protein JAMGFMIE_01077 [Rheinheimera sp. MM224]
MKIKINLFSPALFGVCCLLPLSQAGAQQWSQPLPESSSTPSTEQASSWHYLVGAGAGYMPVYEGSDEFEVIPVPVLSAEYKNGLFFANVRHGIGSYPLRGENYKLGLSIGYGSGRDEKDDRTNLQGMGDIDPSATANLLAEYDWAMFKFSAKLSAGLSEGYGTTAELKTEARYPLSSSIILMAAVAANWGDEDYMNSRFGISAEQAVLSGYSPFQAEAGVSSVGLSLGFTYLLSKQWNLTLMAKADKLNGELMDSPLVKEDLLPAVFLTTSYRF